MEIKHYTRQLNTHYGRMKVLKNDLVVGKSIENYGEWGQAEIDLLSRILEPAAVVVDIGAFIGTHTLAFSRCVGPQGKVYAFEPRPEYFAVLQENVMDNSLNNVKAVNAALSDKAGYVDLPPLDLNKPLNFGGQGIHYPETVGAADAEHVRVTTVDECGLDTCQLLKIDVEGMEINVLRGAVATLRRLRPIVYAECLTVDLGWPIVLLMRELEYQPFLHIAQSHGSRQPMLLLIPKELSNQIMGRLGLVETLVGLPTADDLVVALLNCPMYLNPFLIGTEAAHVLGLAFPVNSFAVQPEIVRDIEATKKLEQVYASWSWRLTAPLRKISRIVPEGWFHS